MKLVVSANVIVLMLCASCTSMVLVDKEPNQYKGLSDFRFPGPMARPSFNDNELPIELARKVSKAKTTEEILQILNVTISPDIFPDGMQRSRGIVAKPAGCQTEMQAVPVKENPYVDPKILYIPDCVRIPRCSGCCGNSLISCQPVKSQMRNYRHCTSKHDQYNEKECTCRCKNDDEREKCLSNSDRMHWLPEECKCKCNTVTECPTGFYFDNYLCRCQSRGFFIDYERQNVGGKIRKIQPDFVSLNTNNSRRRHKEDPEYK
ncbi:uncharacterized protein LOC106636427 [Copidosoma floridanum]|uniref:uncharacterized protein LOC106636427 n=1 Tax=Copidosoma floridanum TaxID=29053 RepID=UPI000C6FBB64|nr:uncharacterized protein LOC106636427 [Copidosoma floridanum]